MAAAEKGSPMGIGLIPPPPDLLTLQSSHVPKTKKSSSGVLSFFKKKAAKHSAATVAAGGATTSTSATASSIPPLAQISRSSSTSFADFRRTTNMRSASSTNIKGLADLPNEEEGAFGAFVHTTGGDESDLSDLSTIADGSVFDGDDADFELDELTFPETPRGGDSSSFSSSRASGSDSPDQTFDTGPSRSGSFASFASGGTIGFLGPQEDGERGVGAAKPIKPPVKGERNRTIFKQVSATITDEIVAGQRARLELRMTLLSLEASMPISQAGHLFLEGPIVSDKAGEATEGLSPQQIQGTTAEHLVYLAATSFSPKDPPILYKLASPKHSALDMRLHHCYEALNFADVVCCSIRNVMRPLDAYRMIVSLEDLSQCRDQVGLFAATQASVFPHDLSNPFVSEILTDFELRGVQMLPKPVEHEPLFIPEPDPLVNFVAELSPKHCAELITAADMRILERITPQEFLDWAGLTRDERKVRAPNLLAFVDQFNFWHLLMATHILKHRTEKERCTAIMFVVATASHLKKIRNISATISTFSSLSSTAIVRLRHTWALLPPKYLKIIEQLKLFVSPTQNFLQIRKHMFNCSLPAIPHVGLLMQDQTFIRETNPHLLYKGEETDLVNLKRAWLIAKLVVALKFFQHSKYPKRFPEPLVLKLRSQNVLNAETLALVSEAREPRASALATSKSTL